jgi:hypothetical protein
MIQRLDHDIINVYVYNFSDQLMKNSVRNRMPISLRGGGGELGN